MLFHRPRSYLQHPYVHARQSRALMVLFAAASLWLWFLHSGYEWLWIPALSVTMVMVLQGLPVWFPGRRVVQWRIQVNAKVAPEWPREFSSFTNGWRDVISAAWVQLHDVRAWLSANTPHPLEWVVHEEQNVPSWANLVRNGTCLEESKEKDLPLLRLWLVLDETAAQHQAYFQHCQDAGLPLKAVQLGMIAHEMGHAVDRVLRSQDPHGCPLSAGQSRSTEAVADVWEVLSLGVGTLESFSAHVRIMAAARDVDRPSPTKSHGPWNHDTGTHLLALLERPDLEETLRLWPLMPVSVRMRWVWAHVDVVDRFLIERAARRVPKS